MKDMKDMIDMTITMPEVQREWFAEGGFMVIRPSESQNFVFQCEFKKAKNKREKLQRGRKEGIHPGLWVMLTKLEDIA